MAMLCRVLYVLAGLTAALVAVVVLALQDKLLAPGPLPAPPRSCWVPGSCAEDTEDIRPFRVAAADSDLADLRARITADLRRLARPLEDAAFRYGFNSEYLREVAAYWNNTYSWRQQEALLNTFPQFVTRIAGLDIHFLHVRPRPAAAGRRVVPLLLVHGWPGSFVEFLDILPLLTAGNSEVALEVVVPSIPGYGFSAAPQLRGFGGPQTADIFRQLMARLGHERFYCQGGDWGSLVTTVLATLYPDSVLGLHLNMMAAQITPGGMLATWLAQLPGLRYLLADPEDYEKVEAFVPRLGFLLQETGYLHLQATKPDTVGVGLSSSPLGLAAYILEKFSTWTEAGWRELEDGGLGAEASYSRDRLLTNVMVYWLTNSITSSMRYYKENLSNLDPAIARTPVQAPTGFADLPNELSRVSRFQLRGKFPRLVSYNTLASGGHFAAMEVPHLLAEDIIQFITLVENNHTSKNYNEGEL